MRALIVILGCLMWVAIVFVFYKLVKYDRAHAAKPTAWWAWIAWTLIGSGSAIPVLLVRHMIYRGRERAGR